MALRRTAAVLKRRAAACSVTSIRSSSSSSASGSAGSSNRGGNESLLETLRMMARPPMARKRPKLSREELDERARIVKDWSRYCMREEKTVMKKVHDARRCRDKALATLKEISPAMYEHAMTVDQTPWPLQTPYPLQTPPIPGYSPQNSTNNPST